MDGYDELNNKGIKFFNDIKSINEFKDIKIIMTCREKYAEK